MVLGIQKLSGASGPVDVSLPDFAANGINKPAGKVLYQTLPWWPDDGGSIVEGPLQDSHPFTIGEGTIATWARGTRMPWTISFWIRVPSGGGGVVFTLNNPGYLFLGPNNTSFFQVTVTENTISLADNQGYTLSRSIDLNKENTGWHHIWMVYDRDPNENRLLYVDGRNVGWSTSTSTNSLSVGGYAEFAIGGNRISQQVGVTQVISLQSVANEYDICHLGIWGSGNSTLSKYYPFYDPGSTGALTGTWNFPGTSGPYPSLWCEFNYSTGWNVTKGYTLEGRNSTFDTTNTPANIFDAEGTLSQAGTGTITEAS